MKKRIKTNKIGKARLELLDDGKVCYIILKFKDNVHNILHSTFKIILTDYFDSIKITDDRDDAVQFCYSHDNDIWVYFEYNYNSNTLNSMTVNLRTFSIEEQEYSISGYYPSLEEVKRIYGESSNQIIAECIFENSIF